MIGLTYYWKASSVIRETNEAVTIIFDTNGQSFSYKPGQFINVQLLIEGERIMRSYSLSSSGNGEGPPAITIKRVEGGKMSSYIFSHAEEIKHWEIDGPYGSFYIDGAQGADQPVILMGGGSGITPLYSMLKYLLKHTDAVIYLINCNRTWEDVIFAAAITHFEKSYEGRFRVHHFLSRESKDNQLPCPSFTIGRPNKLLLKKSLKNWLGNNVLKAKYYLCGPTDLLKMTREMLEGLNIDASNVQQEYFSPVEGDAGGIVLPQDVKEVLLHFYEQTNLLEVAPGRTILETALEDKIPLPYSCKNGTCGKCAGKLLSGKVHMKQNYALTEDHTRDGFVLLCQSHPLDDHVVVAIE